MFILKKGSNGQEVKRMQERLRVDMDGVFGEGTEKALKHFQSHHGLVPDGVYGLATQAVMGTEIWEGIDVSTHNGIIDWDKVGKSNVKFASIKLTEGRTHKNKNRKINWDGAKKNNLLISGYHFARPDSDSGVGDAQAEASHFISVLKDLGWKKGQDLAPCLDLEAGMKTDDQYNAKWCLDFCEEIEDLLGVTPLVYTAKWFWDAFLSNGEKGTLKKICKYPVWWANYTSNTSSDPNIIGWDSWAAWQWTGSGACDGIVGKVDLDWIPGGKCGLEKLKGLK